MKAIAFHRMRFNFAQPINNLKTVMKRSKVIFGVMAIAGLAVVGCKKPDPNTPPAVGSANISGVIWANLDQSNDTDAFGAYIPGSEPEFAPSGTNMTFIINEGDLDYNPDPTFTYQNLYWNVAIGANGTFTVDVPAINRPLDVTVMFDDFYYAPQGYSFVNPDSNFFNDQTEFTLTAGASVLGIIDGGSYILEAAYLP